MLLSGLEKVRVSLSIGGDVRHGGARGSRPAFPRGGWNSAGDPAKPSFQEIRRGLGKRQRGLPGGGLRREGLPPGEILSST